MRRLSHTRSDGHAYRSSLGNTWSPGAPLSWWWRRRRARSASKIKAHAFVAALMLVPLPDRAAPQRFSFECVAPLLSFVGLQKAGSQQRVNASRKRCQLFRAARRAGSVANASNRCEAGHKVQAMSARRWSAPGTTTAVHAG